MADKKKQPKQKHTDTVLKWTLIPVGGLALVGGGIGGGIAIGKSIQSKKSVEEHILAGDTDVKIYGDEIYTYWKFTLLAPLGDNQEIVTDLVDDQFYKFSSVEEGLTVKDRLVQIPVIRNTDNVVSTSTSTYNIKFTCRDKTTKKEAWTKEINDCKVSFEPMIDIDDNKEKYTFSLSDDKKTMTFTYQFKLLSELGQISGTDLDLTCYVLNNISLYETDKMIVTPSVKIDETERTKVTVTLTCTTTDASEIGEGKTIEPILQFECSYKQSSWWQSNVFSGIKCCYSFTEVESDLGDLDLVEETTNGNVTSYTLKGLTAEAKEKGVNTLVIPASTTKWVRVIGDGTGTLKNIENIRKIKFAGIGAQEVAAQAFYGCSDISCLDLSGIPDSVKRLDLISFGTNAFAGLADKGSIIWAKDMSVYKKHMIKEQFYLAGLNKADWFGIISVSNLTQLKEVASTGGYIQLTDDINVTQYIEEGSYTGQINFTSSCILDLHGHKLYCDKPIYNIDKAEYAIIGIWDCEVVVTDTSNEHNGSIMAYDYVSYGQTKPEDTDLPTQMGKEYETLQWAYSKSGNTETYKPRETRCFYIRSDIPTKKQGTLEILAGNFYGNCTCVYNYNTIAYIEEFFESENHDFAPQFHITTANFGTKPHQKITNPTSETLNCLESTFQSGKAYFDVYGAKFYSYPTSTAAYDEASQKWIRTEGAVTKYDPFVAPGDSIKDPTTQEYIHPNYVDGHKLKLSDDGKRVVEDTTYYKPTGYTPVDGYKAYKNYDSDAYNLVWYIYAPTKN